MDKVEFTVTEELDGARLDKAVGALMKGATRAKVKRAVEAGAVRVNGRRAPKGAVVAKGDTIAVDKEKIADSDAPALPNAEATVTILFESPGVLVADKPSGQPCAPLRPGEMDTLCNALLGHYPELATVGYSPREPGLLHRLDTDTSGVVIVARTVESFATLKAALKEDRIDKSYLLVCASEGLPDEGTIAFPITNHPKDSRRVYPCIHPRDVMRYAPRPASTDYRVERRCGQWALVKAFAPRALRHQIRVHFAAIDHPLAGDVLYGGAEIRALGRHALHADHVAFDGAGSSDLAFDVTSPLPEAMAALVRSSDADDADANLTDAS
jgi:23S rRNA pseudouridine1911/1915/1917 synthase